jgi:hypothetical protein
MHGIFSAAVLLETGFGFPIFVGVIVMLGLGFLIASVSSFRLFQRWRQLKKSLKAHGQVVEIVKVYGGVHAGGWLFAPKVTFQTAQNQVCTFTSETATRPAQYSLGEIVELYYDPQNPQKAGLTGDSWDIWIYGGMIVVGLGTMFFGFILAITSIYFAMK